MATAGSTLADTVRFGPYEVTGVLGRGSAGVVYRAADAASGAEVALKACACDSPAVTESIRRDIRALRRLQHPGVVRILNEGVTDGQPWFAMDMLRGQTLRERFEDTRAARSATDVGSDLERVLSIIAGLCEPLAYIHHHGVVHGDLKPENIHLGADDTPVLVDFGLHRRASGAQGREGLEVGGVMRGTQSYMAPEQFWGELIDARADLYALGCLLYEAITGSPPFVGSPINVMRQHMEQEPERPSMRLAGVPEWLDVLVMQLLAKRRNDRLGYADLVARRIAAHVGGGALPPPVVRSYVYRPDLVGRDELVGRLTATVDAACNGRGSVTFVVGESGIGKTRLAMEVGTIAVRRGMDVVLGECDAGSGDDAVLSRTALQPFRPFFQYTSDRCRTGGDEATARLLGVRGPVLAGFEHSLAALPLVAALGPVPDVSPEAALDRLTRAVCDTLAAAASDKPLVLILDDLQWADDLSLHVFETLVSRTIDDVPLAVLATCRAEEIDEPLRALMERSGNVVRVERLEKRVVDRMVGDMLALPAPAAEFTTALFDHSEGNPFYVSEYVLVAVEQGYLRRNGHGAWEVARPRDIGHATYTLPTPGSLQELVRSRLDRLPRHVRRVAEIGSTIGSAFEEMLLLSAVEQSYDEATEAVDELVARQVLRRERSGILSFAHAKIREVAYDALDVGTRVDLHEHVACAIETSCTDPIKLSSHRAALAYHWTRVAVHRRDDRSIRGKALEALELAGRQASQANDHQQSVRLYTEAIRLDRDVASSERADVQRRAVWHRELGDSHFRLGQMQEARTELSAALALAGSRVPSGVVAVSVGLATAIARQVPRRLFGARREPVRTVSDDGLVEARTYDLLSFVQFLLMERTPSLVSSLRSLNRAEDLPLSSALVNSSAMIGTVAGTLIGPSLARRYFGMALESARRLGDDLALGRAAEMHGFYLIGQGDWPGASASLTEAIAAFDRIGDRPWRDIAVLTFANLQFMQHRLASAHYDVGFRGGVERGDVQCQSWGALGRAADWIQRGDYQRGLETIDAGVDGQSLVRRFEALSDVTSLLILYGVRSLALYRRGEYDAAVVAIETACSLLPRAPLFRYDPLPGYVLTADVAARLWGRARAAGSRDEPQLAQLATTTLRYLRAFSRFIPIARPHAAIAQGLASWARGRQRHAHAEWRRAARLATRLAMPYERALAILEIARHGGSVDRATLAEAGAAFAALETRFECDLVSSVYRSDSPATLAG